MFKTIIGVLDVKKNPTPEEIQKIPSFIFCNWLSGSPHAIFAANQINYYSDIPIENQYKMIKIAFGGKIKYIPYPKKIQEDEFKHVDYLVEHFKISQEKAKEYLTIMDKSELKRIVDMYEEYYSK